MNNKKVHQATYLPQRLIRSVRGRLLNLSYFLKRYKSLLQDRPKWQFLAIHNCYMAQLPFAVPLVCKPLRGKVKTEPSMLILSVDNRSKTPVLQKCCAYLGITNYHRIKSSHHGPWRHNAKIVDLHRYLNGCEQLPEYILYADSEDVIFREDPKNAIDLLKAENCKILFSGEPYVGAYGLMPEAKAAVDEAAKRHNVAPAYVNAGVFVAETKFLLRILQEALQYVDASDISAATFREWHRRGVLCEELAKHPKGFPYGAGCDQEIMRFLQHKYPDEMKVDFFYRLAVRGFA